ncbi:Thiol peroxidase, Tpx-type [hydrothermal vent metagenome]|uniref:Thiol peroxidase, Tpx-type n=1 Tax=hydrothermal vent metagenome TaxID=652676 RepID=A0A3B0YH73_9ZZZZ
MAIVSLRGNKCNTCGDMPALNSQAPDFILADGNLKNISLLDYDGKKKIIYTVPSLDTPTCQTSTKIFNERVSHYSDVIVLIVSSDLPFAMRRYCGIEKLTNVQPLSMMRSRQFSKDYGVLLEDGPLAGIMTRSVTVLDENNKVRYTELVTEISDEPDYDGAFSAM